MEDHECVPIPEDERLPNCVYYLDTETCDLCESGYLIVEGQCLQIQAQNCVEFENVQSCLSCSPGQGLQEENGIVNCVSVNVANCLVNEPLDPYPCIKCEGGYYTSNEGVCVKVVTPIPNCVAYDSGDTCAQCDSTSALSSDKKTCDKSTSVLALLDTNCVNSQIRENPVCNTCKPGHIFENG